MKREPQTNTPPIANDQNPKAERQHGPAHELPQILAAAADVAAHVVGVVAFEIGRAAAVAGEDALSKPGREGLYVRFDGFAHLVRIDPLAHRHVAIGPGCVNARGAAAGIDHGRLRENEKRGFTLRTPAVIFLRASDGLVGGCHVHGGGEPCLRRRPRNGSVQRPIHLEHAWPIPVGAQAAAIASWQPITREALKGLWADVQKHATGRRQVPQRVHGVIHLHLAAERAQVIHHRRAQRSGSPARHGPTV